jgi:hypothetical protein
MARPRGSKRGPEHEALQQEWMKWRVPQSGNRRRFRHAMSHAFADAIRWMFVLKTFTERKGRRFSARAAAERVVACGLPGQSFKSAVDELRKAFAEAEKSDLRDYYVNEYYLTHDLNDYCEDPDAVRWAVERAAEREAERSRKAIAKLEREMPEIKQFRRAIQRLNRQRPRRDTT